MMWNIRRSRGTSSRPVKESMSRRRSHTRTLGFEPLEARRLLTTVDWLPASSSLTIEGTPGDDTVYVGAVDVGGTWYAMVNDATQTLWRGDEDPDGNVTTEDVGSITIITYAGNDLIRMAIPTNLSSVHADFGYDHSKLDGDIVIHAGGDNPEEADSDTVHASSFAEWITGDVGDDTLWGWRGQDSIWGGAGDDEIHDDGEGSGSLSQVYGDAGDDEIVAGFGRFVIYGGSGEDNIDASGYNDSIFGGAGADVIHADDGNDWIESNSVDGEEGTDLAFGEWGNDTILGGTGNDGFDGGLNDDSIVAGSGPTFIDGGAGVDTLIGGPYGSDRESVPEVNVIRGGPGGDSIVGGTGSENIWGGAGQDTIVAGDGGDQIWGDNDGPPDPSEPDVDTIKGGAHNDTIHGEGGGDFIFGDSGYDRIFGGDGHDEINGGTECDYLEGGGSDDALVGAQGDDTLVSGGQDDYLDGGTGHDLVDAVQDNDMPESCHPTVTGLTDDPDPLFVRHDLTLTATGVTDFAPGTVTEVKFYWDSNRNGTLEIGTDGYLDNDTDGSDGWSCIWRAFIDPGTHTYFAHAVDNHGNVGNWVSTTNEARRQQVKIEATDGAASEIGPNSGQFTVTRVTGATPLELQVAISVSSGGIYATNGTDYTVSGHANWPTYVTIPADQSYVTITINPVQDGVPEPTEAVPVSVTSGALYDAVSPSSATVNIEDAVPTVYISGIDATASESGPTSGHFIITRTGSTVGSLIVNVAMSGTATNGMDYQTIGASVTIDGGYSSKTVYINPYSDMMPEATETAILTIGTSSLYYRGSPYSDVVSITNSGALLLASPPAAEAVADAPPTMSELLPLIDEAVTRWVAAGADPARLRAALAGLQVRVLDMPDEHLARIVPGYLVVDVDAAGHGWYIDATPGDDAEFAAIISDTERAAIAGAPFGRADLLTVLTHEIGHLLDLDDLRLADLTRDDHPHDLMAEALPLSARRLPAAGQGAHELADKVALDPAQAALQRMLSAFSLVAMLGQEGSFWQAAGIDAETLTVIDDGAAGLFASYIRGVRAPGEEPPPEGAPEAPPLEPRAFDQALLDAETERVWSAVDDLLFDLGGYNPLAGSLETAALDALFAEWGAGA